MSQLAIEYQVSDQEILRYQGRIQFFFLEEVRVKSAFVAA